MHARRQHEERLLDPSRPPYGSAPEDLEPCGCGATGYTDATVLCERCGGSGQAPRPAPAEEWPEGQEPVWLADVAEFLQVWALREREGGKEALRLLGEKRWHPLFLQALMVFNTELDRLERAAALHRVSEDRKRPKPKG